MWNPLNWDTQRVGAQKSVATSRAQNGTQLSLKLTLGAKPLAHWTMI